MKTMTCNQLGGACEMKFTAATFEEIAEMSKRHGSEMFKKGDTDHIEAMNKMMEFMHNPEEMKAWFNAKKAEFDAL